MASSRYAICLASIILISTSSGAGLGAHPGKRKVSRINGNENASNAVCPEPEVIFPCTCVIPQPHNEVLDCSNVTSERELRSILHRDFPTNYFMKFLMDGNKYVSTLSEGTFGEKRFRKVVITNGVLGRVEPKALLGSVLSLQEIDLESNYLTYFPAEEIPLYTNLESLNLRDNKLTSLANILSQTLLDVRLDRNPMGHVPVDFLQDVPELQIFSCSSCGLTEIQTGTFTRGPQLRFVDLGYNELTFLPEGAFNLAPFESMLVLSDNKLSSVAKGAINGVTFELEIQDNQFEQLYEDVWRPVFENTTNVSLYKNPLLCDCDTAWLITDQDIVYKYLGIGDCKNGTYFHELDPAYYEEIC